MNLTAYLIDDLDVEIRPAPLERRWMDNSPQKFAYRCLPLNIANTYGWEILNKTTFQAMWNGGPAIEDIFVTNSKSACTHFGCGILTFHIDCIFRTDPGFDLMVQGPINQPKDGISPLTGIVETDWSPYTFTMNWKFTRAAKEVSFLKGEPICHIFPIQRGSLETVVPVKTRIHHVPDLKTENDEWSKSRSELNDDPELSRKIGWQKHYFQGKSFSGERAKVEGGHRTKVKLKDFIFSE